MEMDDSVDDGSETLDGTNGGVAILRQANAKGRKNATISISGYTYDCRYNIKYQFVINLAVTGIKIAVQLDS